MSDFTLVRRTGDGKYASVYGFDADTLMSEWQGIDGLHAYYAIVVENDEGEWVEIECVTPQHYVTKGWCDGFSHPMPGARFDPDTRATVEYMLQSVNAAYHKLMGF